MLWSDSAAVASHEAGRATSATGTAGPLVLIVDDELPLTRMLRIVLTSNGFRTAEATSAAQALAHASAYNPEIILSTWGFLIRTVSTLRDAFVNGPRPPSLSSRREGPSKTRWPYSRRA